MILQPSCSSRQDKARNAEKAYQEMAHKAAAAGGLPGEASHPQEEGAPDMARWKRNLASSAWSRRRAYAVEQSITDTITGADGTAYHIRGSLDAVFLGRAEDDPASPAPGYYTIVDWKTGHKPECGSRQERVKLAQLDIYRLMFSHMMGIDISHIDAVLYYVDIDNGLTGASRAFRCGGNRLRIHWRLPSKPGCAAVPLTMRMAMPTPYQAWTYRPAMMNDSLYPSAPAVYWKAASAAHRRRVRGLY